MSGVAKVVLGGDGRPKATLYLGDCMDILPTLGKVDAVVTDPPYGLGTKMKGGTWGTAEKYGAMWVWDRVPPPEIFTALLCLSVPMVIWGGNYFSLPPSRCWLSWSKVNSVQTMSDIELAWTNQDRPSKEIRLPVGTHDTGHPTQKPTRLMVWCLEFAPGACVLDPFMGSGTTGVACAQTGRDFIGIEIDPGYFEIACKRIKTALDKPGLFDAVG